jgi:putative membrane protein
MIRKTTMIAVLALFAGACATTDMNTMPGGLPQSDIAGIVMAANEGEIQQGNAASQRASSAAVRSFAQMMVADHTNALNEGRDVFGRVGVTPGENETSRRLRNDSQRTVTNLNTYSGAAFDRAYVQTQVNLHQWLLDTLDSTLIPSASSTEVRALLQKQRGSVATHLDHARRLLGSL